MVRVEFMGVPATRVTDGDRLRRNERLSHMEWTYHAPSRRPNARVKRADDRHTQLIGRVFNGVSRWSWRGEVSCRHRHHTRPLRQVVWNCPCIDAQSWQLEEAGGTGCRAVHRGDILRSPCTRIIKQSSWRLAKTIAHTWGPSAYEDFIYLQNFVIYLVYFQWADWCQIVKIELEDKKNTSGSGSGSGFLGSNFRCFLDGSHSVPTIALAPPRRIWRQQSIA